MTAAPPPSPFAPAEAAQPVAAIDLATRRAAATRPAGATAHAMAVTQDGARLYVVNRRGRSLTVVDARAPAVLDTITLASDPMGAAISPDGRWLAVLGRDRLVAWLLDPATGAVQHELALGDAAPDAGPPGPRSTHPVWAPDSASFYAQDNVHGALVRVDVALGATGGA